MQHLLNVLKYVLQQYRAICYWLCSILTEIDLFSAESRYNSFQTETTGMRNLILYPRKQNLAGEENSCNLVACMKFIYLASVVCDVMSEEKKDRFKRIDGAIDKVREEIDEAADESKELGGKATKEVREAIDNLEERVSNLRKKKEE
jgi:predicted nucleotide-binding protein (sugar kinase/HSP70/actin superfamily)